MFTETEYHRQVIVEIVRHTPGQQTDLLKPLGLLQPLFESDFVCDIAQVRDDEIDGIGPLPAGILVSQQGSDDGLEIVLPGHIRGVLLRVHQQRSPTFSGLQFGTLEESIAEWTEDFDDPDYVTFVADPTGRST